MSSAAEGTVSRRHCHAADLTASQRVIGWRSLARRFSFGAKFPERAHAEARGHRHRRRRRRRRRRLAPARVAAICQRESRGVTHSGNRVYTWPGIWSESCRNHGNRGNRKEITGINRNCLGILGINRESWESFRNHGNHEKIMYYETFSWLLRTIGCSA